MTTTMPEYDANYVNLAIARFRLQRGIFAAEAINRSDVKDYLNVLLEATLSDPDVAAVMIMATGADMEDPA